MQIIIAIYDGGYAEGLLIGNNYYNYKYTYRLACRGLTGDYTELYKEICEMLDNLKLFKSSNIEVIIIEDAYILRVWYYKYAYILNSPTYYDVITPDGFYIENEILEEKNNGRS